MRRTKVVLGPSALRGTARTIISADADARAKSTQPQHRTCASEDDVAKLARLAPGAVIKQGMRLAFPGIPVSTSGRPSPVAARYTLAIRTQSTLKMLSAVCTSHSMTLAGLGRGMLSPSAASRSWAKTSRA